MERCTIFLGRIAKMAILPKAIYRVNAVPMKIAREYFTKLEKNNFIYGTKGFQIIKTVLRNKNSGKGIMFTDFTSDPDAGKD